MFHMKRIKDIYPLVWISVLIKGINDTIWYNKNVFKGIKALFYNNFNGQ